EVAVWVMERAVETTRDNADNFRLLADAYEAAKQFPKALKVLELVKKIDPDDHKVAMRMRQMEANQTLASTGYEQGAVGNNNPESLLRRPTGQGGPTDGGADTPEKRAKREIDQLVARCESDAANPDAYIQLADVYKRQGQNDKAVETYRKAVAAGTADPEVKVKLMDCEIEAVKKNVAHVRDQFAKLDKTSNSYAEQAKRLDQQMKGFSADLHRREIELYRFRTDQNNQDFAAFFELGVRHLKAKQFDEAIRALQQGRNDSARRWEALMWLGIAFWQKRNLSLAEKNLVDAADAVPKNDEDARKQVLYYRARLAEERQDMTAATDFYNEIAAVDYSYKDVAKRLDAINSGQSPGADSL
ncbi:MAG: tetratricopeptide repeat protein, partial [Planctomycetia bacterium]